jgi:hypothetical protein
MGPGWGRVQNFERGLATGASSAARPHGADARQQLVQGLEAAATSRAAGLSRAIRAGCSHAQQAARLRGGCRGAQHWRLCCEHSRGWQGPGGDGGWWRALVLQRVHPFAGCCPSRLRIPHLRPGSMHSLLWALVLRRAGVTGSRASCHCSSRSSSRGGGAAAVPTAGWLKQAPCCSRRSPCRRQRRIMPKRPAEGAAAGGRHRR